MRKQDPRGAVKVIAIACMIFGMAWLAIGMPFFLRQLDVLRHWPSENAVLNSTSIVEDSTSGEKVYKTHFQFAVECPSGPHAATVEGYRISVDRNKVEAEAARWNIGARYVVRVNPKDPSEIRLDVDRPFRHFLLPSIFGSIAAIFFGISGALIFFSRPSSSLTRN